jgi:hypothetical protein
MTPMAPRGNPRETSFKFVLSEEERNWLMFMAHQEGVPAAAFLRQIIRQRWKDQDDAKMRRALAKFLEDAE